MPPPPPPSPRTRSPNRTCATATMAPTTPWRSRCSDEPRRQPRLPRLPKLRPTRGGLQMRGGGGVEVGAWRGGATPHVVAAAAATRPVGRPAERHMPAVTASVAVAVAVAVAAVGGTAGWRGGALPVAGERGRAMAVQVKEGERAMAPAGGVAAGDPGCAHFWRGFRRAEPRQRPPPWGSRRPSGHGPVPVWGGRVRELVRWRGQEGGRGQGERPLVRYRLFRVLVTRNNKSPVRAPVFSRFP